MIIVGAALGFVLALGAATALFQFSARRVYSYALTPTRLEVRLFGRIPVYRVARNTITSVRDWHYSLAQVGATFIALRLGNRIFGRAIVIERRAGFPRQLIITPDDPAVVIAALRSRSTVGNDR